MSFIGGWSIDERIARFWGKVDKNGLAWKNSCCWIWKGGTSKGYGYFWDGTRLVLAHRFAYELLIGPMDSAKQGDHLCRNRRCVNPLHIEEVTSKVNLLRGEGPTGIKARQTHCIHGHSFTKKNTYIRPNGTRYCRACGANNHRRSNVRLRKVNSCECGKEIWGESKRCKSCAQRERHLDRVFNNSRNPLTGRFMVAV